LKKFSLKVMKMQPFKYKPNNNSGTYRHRIDILHPVPIEDELGQEVVQWGIHKSIWAAIKTMQGREYFAAAATRSENTVRFIIRYVEDIDSSMRIGHKNNMYDIISVINDDELNETLTIIAKVGGQDG
jgi:SPP1 family predicted phage head-tail adaptor